MQVGIDIKCMRTSFGGCGLFGFGDIATFINGKFPFLPMDYSPWSSKILMDRNWLKKFMQVGVDVTYMHTNFGGCGLSGFGDQISFKNDQISLFDHGLYSMVIKKFNQSESAQKILQVGIDVKCIHTKFGGHDLSGFGDIATFKNSQISLSDDGL